MPVTLLEENVEVSENGDNHVVVNEYDFPIVLEESGRYIGIESDGAYSIFEKGTVKRLINPTSCVAIPETPEPSNSLSGAGKNSQSQSVEVDVENLSKPVGSVIKTLMSEYTVIHGNTQRL